MHNLIDPAILFFLFGIAAGLIRSNLEIPPAISKFLSLYLLMALGLKGGFALAESGFSLDVLKGLGAAVLLAIAVPLIGYQYLRRVTSPLNAAALAATYGSVSAVTFITTVQYLDTNGIAYSGHMAAAMALMESPAIILAVLLANMVRQQANPDASRTRTPFGKVLHEAFTDGAQLLLIGAMLIGFMTGEAGQQSMAPFSVDLFKGMLAFFLLDMGLLTARNLSTLKDASTKLIAYAVLGPLLHASIAFALSAWFSLSVGRRSAAHGLVRKRVLYCGTSGFAFCYSRGPAVPLLWLIAGGHFSAEYYFRDTVLRRHRANAGVTTT